METRYLVVIDFPGIKQFVFGSDRLVEIRGASSILDKLNRERIPGVVKERFGSNKSQCIFAGGGAGQFIIDSDAESIHDLFEEIQAIVRRETGGAMRLIYGIADLKDGYLHALTSAIGNLDIKKREFPFDIETNIHSGYLQECKSCSGTAAKRTTFGDESRLLCPVCSIKEDWGKEQELWDEFGRFTGEDVKEFRKKRPNVFDKIGKCCNAKQGFAALVYGDGNSMGRFVREIDSAETFKEFSSLVDSSVRDACYEALEKNCPERNGYIPAAILLLGGDDVMVYLAADTALGFASCFARAFERLTRERIEKSSSREFFEKRLGKKGFTISLGAVIAKSHTPISLMVSQAGELLASAKEKGYRNKDGKYYTPAFIDFHFLNKFNQVSVEDCRRKNLTMVTPKGEKIRLFMGPYSIEDTECLIKSARALKKSGLPSSRLHKLGSSPFNGKVNGSLETLEVYGRSQKSHQTVILDTMKKFGCFPLMPWKQGDDGITTVMVDLVEISGFVQV